jgi:hypothetical protein
MIDVSKYKKWKIFIQYTSYAKIYLYCVSGFFLIQKQEQAAILRAILV